MARRAKPWLRKGRGWYVQHRGKQVALGKDKAEAFRRYHELMHRDEESVAASDSFFFVCDAFLEWTQQHRAPRTYDWYVERLQSFARFLKSDFGSLSVDRVRAAHVRRWLDANPGWSSTTQRQSIIAVQRCFNWAERMGYLDRSPVRAIEKPQASSRERILSAKDYATLLAAIPDRAFRDVILLSWETGCRPQESLRVEARHVDLLNARWVFPPSESKGRRKPRIVYLPGPALEVTKRLIEQHPTGPLLRNRLGNAWTPSAAKCRLRHLATKTGVTACLYDFRHTFATRMLESGLDALTVALLLGHSNPAMLSTTYQHLAHNPQHLRGQLESATR